jgi:hypothetical protein
VDTSGVEPTPDVLALAASTSVQPADTESAFSRPWKTREQASTEDSESEEDDSDEELPAQGWRSWRVLGAAAAVVAVVAAGGYAAWRPAPPAPVHAASGTLEISTNPDGADALVDGVLRGTTPLVLALEPGAHTLELRGGGGDPRTIPITINAGMKVSQYVELSRGSAAAARPAPAPAAPPAPAPAQTTPVQSTPAPIAPAPAASAPTRADVVTDGSAASRTRGTVSLTIPIDAQVYEAGMLVGKAPGQMTLSPGRHELDLVNSDLGVRTAVVAQVTSGKTAAVNVELPTGVLSMNALPWAEVWLDGEKIGETPIGNLQVRVGTHDVVFRNPDLGERHLTTVVSLKGPTRISVDLRAR